MLLRVAAEDALQVVQIVDTRVPPRLGNKFEIEVRDVCNRHADAGQLDLALKLREHELKTLACAGRGRHDVAQRLLLTLGSLQVTRRVGVGRDALDAGDLDVVPQCVNERREAERRAGEHRSELLGARDQVVTDARYDGQIAVAGRRAGQPDGSSARLEVDTGEVARPVLIRSLQDDHALLRAGERIPAEQARVALVDDREAREVVVLRQPREAAARVAEDVCEHLLPSLAGCSARDETERRLLSERALALKQAAGELRTGDTTDTADDNRNKGSHLTLHLQRSLRASLGFSDTHACSGPSETAFACHFSQTKPFKEQIIILRVMIVKTYYTFYLKSDTSSISPYSRRQQLCTIQNLWILRNGKLCGPRKQSCCVMPRLRCIDDDFFKTHGVGIGQCSKLYCST